MRNIKFRAYHTERKQMYWFDLMWGNFNRGGGYIGMVEWGKTRDTENKYNGNQELIDPHNCELMQYTGLKDSENNEVYEGDIVEMYTQTRCNITGTIKWEQQACQYWITWIQKGKERNVHRYEPLQAFYGDTEKYMDTRIKIIGNIYETPTLL